MASVARAAPLLLAVLAKFFSEGFAAKIRTQSPGDHPEEQDHVQIKIIENEDPIRHVDDIRKVSVKVTIPELEGVKVTISEGSKEDRRTFEGIGALSAGASSRLLQDYPDEQRDEILDLLFKPKYGASLQVLKVEIGGDMQSTDGSEPSHMRFRGEKPDCTRGYEGWLFKEAKARNPYIRTYGLAWGVPGWIGNGTFFSEDNIKYHVAWLECMKATYDAEVDYIGIWNEMSWGSSWYVVELGDAIKAAGLSTKLVLLDAINGISAEFLNQFKEDEKLQQMTAAVGLHYPCGEKADATKPLLEALDAHPGTRFWASEELSTVADWGGAGCWGRMINQNFVRMQATSSIAWSLIWSAYPNLECFGNGLLYAFSPWSGYYEVMPPVWATAHTTQFTEPGWQYLPVGDGAGNLPDGGTFVTIASADLKEFSIILETLTGRCMYHNGCFHEKEAKSTQLLNLKLSSTLGDAAKTAGALEVWSTNETHWFIQLSDAKVDEEGVLRASIPVDTIVTITTRSGASKQGRQRGSKPEETNSTKNVPKASAFPLPFKEDFESTDVGRSPPFFADQGGAFEVTEVDDESGKNKVLEQQVLQAPIAWIGKNPAPFSVFGSTNWTDVTFEASVNVGPQRSISRPGPMVPFGHVAAHMSLLSLESRQTHAQDIRLAGICTRVLRYNYFGKSDAKPDGYCLEVVDDSKSMPYWRFTSSGALMAQQKLSDVAINKVFGGGWLKLRMAALQAQISLFVDGKNVFNQTDTSLPMGQVAFGCGYHKCQFDDMVVLPNKAAAKADDPQSKPLQLIQVRPVTFDYAARSCEPPPRMPQLRQDFSGLVGFAFTPTAPVILTALGRYMIRGGNPLADVSQIQLLHMANSVTYLPLASVALPSVLTGQVGVHATADGFIYADLVQNVSLQPGTEYVLACSEISGNSVFYDKATRAQPMEHVKLLGPVYADSKEGWVLTREEAGDVFGPLNAIFAPMTEASKYVNAEVFDTDAESIRVRTEEDAAKKEAAGDSKIKVEIVDGDVREKDARQVKEESGESDERSKQAEEQDSKSEDSTKHLQNKSDEAVSKKDGKQQTKRRNPKTKRAADSSERKGTRDEKGHRDGTKARPERRDAKTALAVKGEGEEKALAHERRGKQAAPEENVYIKEDASEVEVKTLEGNQQVEVNVVTSDAADEQPRQESHKIEDGERLKAAKKKAHSARATPLSNLASLISKRPTKTSVANAHGQQDAVHVDVVGIDSSANTGVEVVDSNPEAGNAEVDVKKEEQKTKVNIDIVKSEQGIGRDDTKEEFAAANERDARSAKDVDSEGKPREGKTIHNENSNNRAQTSKRNMFLAKDHLGTPDAADAHAGKAQKDAVKVEVVDNDSKPEKRKGAVKVEVVDNDSDVDPDVEVVDNDRKTKSQKGAVKVEIVDNDSKPEKKKGAVEVEVVDNDSDVDPDVEVGDRDRKTERQKGEVKVEIVYNDSKPQKRKGAVKVEVVDNDSNVDPDVEEVDNDRKTKRQKGAVKVEIVDEDSKTDYESVKVHKRQESTHDKNEVDSNATRVTVKVEDRENTKEIVIPSKTTEDMPAEEQPADGVKVVDGAHSTKSVIRSKTVENRPAREQPADDVKIVDGPHKKKREQPADDVKIVDGPHKKNTAIRSETKESRPAGEQPAEVTVKSSVRSGNENVVVGGDDDANKVKVDILKKEKQGADRVSEVHEDETATPAETNTSRPGVEESKDDVDVTVVDSKTQSRDENVVVEDDADAVESGGAD